MFKKQIKLILMLIALVCLSLQPVSATTSLNETNVTLVSDLNQTVGKDIRSLVDTNRLDIGNSLVFDVLWSPDGSNMLTDVFIGAYPKGNPRLGGVSALYAANSDGSGITRIAWGECTSSNGGQIVTTPVWSQSGDYFAYLELLEGSMHKIKSAQLLVMSSDLKLVEKIDCDPKNVRCSPEWTPKWSPKENKIAAIVSGKITVYDLDEKTDFSFEMPDDTVRVEDMEWSPDGEKIVFLQNNHDVITLDIENRELNQLYSRDFVAMYGAQWSPDSKKLLFFEKKGSELSGDLSYDVYVMDEEGNNPSKIITFNSGSSKVIQWYPDSERLLVKKRHGDDSYVLYSLSMTGDMNKLIDGDHDLDGMVGPNGYILASVPNPGSRIPPYIETYDLYLLNGSDKLTIENVTYYTWKGTDLLFVKDNEISVLNTSTHDTRDIPISSKNSGRISLAPSGRFIAVDNNILELYEQSLPLTTAGNCMNSTAGEVVILNNDTDDHSGVSTTQKTSELPGFTAIIAFMGVLIAFAGTKRKL
ncbi:hypothetical protein [Methanococcoides burtonii]|uniref:Protein with TolB-like six-bladed beta-propeller domain n=1 Tax=Methanococcoides burtonii (strain DSM 6242 / NBRC 107633 / OCM 468 / ACE-M) TaxID=259564 RepID=Q12V10_METBU|nr:hypothetical protein [Methanococcoides burtonii]ABE52716.1 protein with TolB-like six-bladed beta-propeller domain [Methanococcoides burtonii DSM 6242]